ncbi:MAG TPA: IS1595 family transposase [Puia sp.]|nr:IS1595 family transposase [Puia sp.]
MNIQHYTDCVDGYVFRCPQCKRRSSLRSGTFLDRSKISLAEFLAILFFHHLDVLQKDVSEILGFSPNTIMDYSNIIREQCSNVLISEDEKLGGEGIRVQVDESVISGAKRSRNKKARPVQEKWVVSSYDTEKKVGMMRRVHDRSRETLIECIKEWCLPGTIVVTDGWRGYSEVGTLGFKHEVVVHEDHFVDPETGVHTNAVESWWQRCKRRFKRILGTSDELLCSYLDEFLWRERYGKTIGERWENWFKCLNLNK